MGLSWRLVNQLISDKFSSVQFSSRWYLCARKSQDTLYPVSQRFLQRCLGNGSNVRLIDDGPFSSSQGRSSSASFFHASLLQAIDSVMSLALCPQVVSQASQHFRSSEKQAACVGCFALPASLYARSFPFTPACLQEGGGAGLQVSPEEIMSREVEMGCEIRTSFALSFPQQQCNRRCPCDSAQHGN